MNLFLKTLSFLFLFLITNVAYAQNSSINLNLLFEVLAQSTGNNAATGKWIACRSDNPLNSDTLQFYNAGTYQQEADCCNLLSWQFFNPMHFEQKLYNQCEGNTDNSTVTSFFARYIQEEKFIRLLLYKEKIFTAAFDVIAIDHVQLNESGFCYRITLIKEK